MATTTIPAARYNLYEMLHDQFAAQYQVVYGPPDAYEEDIVIGILEVQPADVDYAALGGMSNEETYRIKVRIKVHDKTANAGDVAEIDQTAWGIYSDIFTLVRNNPQLNGAVNLWATVVTGDPEGEYPLPVVTDNNTPYGWITLVTLLVECKSRI